MKIRTDEKGQMILEEVFVPIVLKTEKENMTICMRDGGFEFLYRGKSWKLEGDALTPPTDYLSVESIMESLEAQDFKTVSMFDLNKVRNHNFTPDDLAAGLKYFYEVKKIRKFKHKSGEIATKEYSDTYVTTHSDHLPSWVVEGSNDWVEILPK